MQLIEGRNFNSKFVLRTEFSACTNVSAKHGPPANAPPCYVQFFFSLLYVLVLYFALEKVIKPFVA